MFTPDDAYHTGRDTQSLTVSARTYGVPVPDRSSPTVLLHLWGVRPRGVPGALARMATSRPLLRGTPGTPRGRTPQRCRSTVGELRSGTTTPAARDSPQAGTERSS